MLMNLPEGCRFAPRCPHATEKCEAEYPRSFKVALEHTADCWMMDR